MGDRRKAADCERGCNRDVETGQDRRALAVAALAPAVSVAAVFALTAGPEPAAGLLVRHPQPVSVSSPATGNAAGGPPTRRLPSFAAGAAKRALPKVEGEARGRFQESPLPACGESGRVRGRPGGS